MKISVKKLELFIHNLIYIYMILLFGAIGIIAIYSFRTNISILKLWKDIYLIILFIICYLKDCFLNKKRIIIISVILGSILFYMVYSYFRGIYPFIIFYQLKSDLSLLLIYIFFSMKDFYLKNKKLKLKILKGIILISFISVLIGIFEFLMPEIFVKKILNIPLNTREAGVTTIYAWKYLRTFGIVQNYIQFGDISLLSFMVINEIKIIRTKLLKNFLKMIFLIGVVISIYKTAYLGLLLYVFFKILKKLKLNYRIQGMMGIGIYIFQFLSYFTYYIYNFFVNVLKIDNLTIEKSFLLRVELAKSVYEQIFSKVSTIIFGLGMGFNGKSSFLINKYGKSYYEKIALDSTFLSVISNYGMLLFFIIVIFTIKIILQEKNFLKRIVYVYYLVICFFVNNFYSHLNIMLFISLITVGELKVGTKKSN